MMFAFIGSVKYDMVETGGYLSRHWVSILFLLLLLLIFQAEYHKYLDNLFSVPKLSTINSRVLKKIVKSLNGCTQCVGGDV